MPYKKVLIPELGEVLLSKKSGARHLRLSVTPRGQVRVSVPAWTPYGAGIAFAMSRKEWLLEQLALHHMEAIGNHVQIGKSHRVVFIQTFKNQATKIRTKGNIIEVSASEAFESPGVQEKLLKACEKALRAEAEQLLPLRLKALAQIHNFRYKDVRIRKLVSRWGSCSKDGTITLSYYLVQLPWHLIDYVLLHELTHTKHLHHGTAFWDGFKVILPEARALQKEIRSHKPTVQPLQT